VLSKFRSRLTYANVMATIAVFIALGGSSYAAIKVTGKNVKDSSLTGKDIKNNSVTGKDVKGIGSGDVRDRSLLSQDFAPGQLPQGEKGEKGDEGEPGTARAYAYVDANGVLDLTRSKGVADVRPPCTGSPGCSPPPAAARSHQCFRLDAAAQNAVATTDIESTRSGARVAVPAGLATTCPSGYQDALVFTFDTTTGNGQAAGFFVIFN
jgi:hypothetical protein